jgi:hypothetical protein
MEDANFAIGSGGLASVDKIGNQNLSSTPGHLQPRSRLMHLHRVFTNWLYRLTIGPPMPRSAGDGIHGKSPHPGHLIALFDLVARRHACDFRTYPYLAPHGLR